LAPRGDDPPALGSLAARLAPSRQGLPSFIMMPARLFDQSTVLRGQAGGWLGNRYDPLIIAQDPNRADFRLDGFGRDSDVSSLRLDARQSLLAALDPPSTAAPACVMSEFRQRAFDLLTTAKGQAAFDLTEEPSAVRERYGRNPFGQGCLLARRLVEAGVRLVTVSDCTPTGHHAWDTHSKNFETLKDTLLPRLDQAYSALLEDLLARGLLGETVVYLGGEFGRTPRIGLSTAAGATPDGRDHWPDCFSGVLAGGLTRAGMVYGASDARAAHPSENAMTPQDLAATLFAAMGLDPETMVKTRDNRPMPISPGTVHRGLLA
jgi:hypothetical protein